MSQAKLKLKLSAIAALDANEQCRFLVSLDGLAKSNLLPAKTTYWVARIKAVAEPEIAAYEQARRAAILRLGTKVNNGASIVIAADKIPEFTKEMEAINHEIELPISERLKLPWNEKLAVDMTPLLDIIEEPTGT